VDPLLSDLCGHDAWADAVHWRSFEAFPKALEDPKILERLFHIHLVQHAFAWVLEGQKGTFARPKPSDFETARALKDYGRQFHERLGLVLAGAPQELFERKVVIPWFKDPPVRVSVAEALVQAAMHTHYHRGQNAVRLREMGGQPSPTDLIVWYWKGRPLPEW
jgi:uncharacterized damage-inducible protein DinB